MHLTEGDRELIESYRTKGLHQAREINRAHVLSALDRGLSEAQIMAVVLASDGRLSGGHEGLTWKAALNTRCATGPPRQALAVRHRRRGAGRRLGLLEPPNTGATRAGQSDCWDRPQAGRPVLARSAGRPSAGC